MRLLFKYNPKKDTYMSINLRGKIIKPDRECQRTLPKEDFVADAYYTRDISNCSFVDVKQIYKPMEVNVDYLQNYLSDCTPDVKFLLLTENNIVLSHSVICDELLVEPILVLQDRIIKFNIISFSVNSDLYRNLFRKLSEHENLDKIKLEVSDYDALMKKSFQGVESDFCSAQLYRHYITKGDFRSLKPVELLIIRRKF